MRILIVEDDIKVLRFIKGALEAEGHQLETASDYGTFEEYVSSRTYQPELVIMDRMLHGKDSTRLLPQLRRDQPEAKVLILSAISTVEEKASILDLGADDYLGKPFSLVELSARIRALTRRTVRMDTPTTSSHLRFRDLHLDLLQRCSWVGTTRLELSNKEFQLLTTLLRAPGRVFNKFQLIDQVWEMQADIESNVVEVTIRNLRTKLAECDSTVTIQNRRNVGYWIEN